MKKSNERTLQKSLHQIISDPSKTYATSSGRRLQILSPGNLNYHEGPDFREAAILIGGTVCVGDLEFHRNSSEWLIHNHHTDPNYDNVVLHIVCNDNKDLQLKCETLVIDEYIIVNNIENLKMTESANSIFTLEELQHYSLIRLLRKASEAQKVLNFNDLKIALKILTDDYLTKYISKRRRPSYSEQRLQYISNEITHSIIMDNLIAILRKNHISIPDTMAKMMKSKILDEGPHLRREIILNAILPIMLCLADEKARIDLFLWYWSTPALNQYGVLQRKFPDLPQNYIWQQQGMLEFINLHGKKKNILSESIKAYGFAEVLSFYKLGNSPFRTIEEEF